MNTRKQHAQYWSYQGNHPNGQDCSRHNPYGYPLELIRRVAWEYQDTPEVSVKCLSKDSFGRTIDVAAPKHIWEKVKKEMEIEAEAEIDYEPEYA
ncbi:MAG: hypothetical protein NVS2B14_00160 [Chamaesiphon sp.]